MKHADTDIAIAGCGPAGALLAVLLSCKGYRVTCIASPARAARIEGLGQRTIDVMRVHGLRNALSTVRQSVPRQAIWGGETAHYNQEYIVSRNNLDDGLLDDVRAAGADVAVGRCTRQTVIVDHVELGIRRSEGGDQTLRARFFVEGRGRAAPRIRNGGMRGPETTALVREVRPAHEPQTIVESLADGWAWYVSNGERSLLQVFVDSSQGLPKREHLTPFFERICREARDERIRHAETFGPVMSRNATTYLAGELFAGRSLRIGDAAMAVDPLSGHGIFAALGSALAASATINTILSQPENTDTAIRFYSDRAQHSALRNARIGRDFYRLEEHWAANPFWHSRRNWPDSKPAHIEAGDQDVCIQAMPVVSDGLIVEERVVVTPEHPRGVWQVDNIALVPLLEAARATGDVSSAEFIETAAGKLEAQPKQVITALNWLKSAGALA